MQKGNERPGIDRRKYVRYACKAKLKTIVDFDPAAASKPTGKLPPIVFQRGESAFATNISQKGICLELDHFLPESMTLKIAIENPSGPLAPLRIRRFPQSYGSSKAYQIVARKGPLGNTTLRTAVQASTIPGNHGNRDVLPY